MSDTDRPERVRVTGPPRRRASGVRPTASREIDADSDLGAIYMSSLLGEQLRLAAGVLVAMFLTVGLLPLVFHVFPDLSGLRLLGVPVPWLLLGVLVYPWLLVLGWVYVRRAEANERDFADLVSDGPDARP
ncbi:hypothetical protein [Nocardioides sp. P5_C9_2]